jgi:hypothetical protein
MSEATKTTAVETTRRSMEEHAARLQAAFVTALSEDDLRTIARTLIDQARDGDTTSARLVLKYGLDHVKFAATDQTLQAAARRAVQPPPDQMMAILRQRMQEQEALEREIRGGAGRPPLPPSSVSARPTGTGVPGGSAAR